MIVKKIYILVNKMIVILDSSIFKTLNRKTFSGMFVKEKTVIVNGRECVIMDKKARSACFMIRLLYGDIIFEIHFKFNSDDIGSLASMNMMFLDNTIISDDMTIIRHLGAGAFGNVFLVSVSGKEYALKVGLDISRGSNQVSAIQNEVNIFAFLRQNSAHPNLIQSFPIDFPLGPAVLLELGQETLDKKIESMSLSLEQTMEIMRQILSAVAFLHSIRISHHDLKPNNIIIVDGVPKLLDFGLSYCWETDDSFRRHNSGTQGYKHPNPTTNQAQDVFSCCFIFIEMLIGKKVRYRIFNEIMEIFFLKIVDELKEKCVSEENIKKIVFEIYENRRTIELNHLIKLVESIH
jgi:serine/threonine protein kinase